MPPSRVVDPEDAEATKKAVCPRIALLPVRYTKTIHLVRHGQGYHNVAGAINRENYKLWDYVDAHLTDLGWRQAESLGRHVAAVRLPVDLVVVAPLQRALETAVAAFGNHDPEPAELAAGPGPGSAATAAAAEAPGSANGVNGAPQRPHPLMVAQTAEAGRRAAHAAVSSRGCPPFLAHELCREHLGVHPCDRRSSVAVYQQRFPAVDFSLVQPDDDVLWSPDHRETKDEIRRRGLSFLKWLAARPERHIAVVSHSSFLFFMTSCFAHDAAPVVQAELHKWYDNCEMRSVTLTDDSEGGAAAAAAGGPDPWHFPGGTHSVS